MGKPRAKPKGPARPTATVAPNRRRLIVVTAAAAIAAAIVIWLWSRPVGIAVAPDGNRNVLLVTIDTLRADALGCYGGAAATPNLDRLAADGLRFTSAHAHTVVTLPSHTSILTGVYPFVHGVRDNAGYRLPPGATTIATLLKPAGYATGAFVGAFPLDSRWGLSQGFDTYDDAYGGTSQMGDFLMPERRADKVVDAATQWIRQQHGKWFAWVHVYDPHAPYQPPPPFDQQYSADAYAGEVAYTDRELGPLFELARSAPRDTLIIVTSDHGEALGSHGEQTHGLFAYEATLHIPLIVNLTRHPHALGTPSTDMAARHVDLLPTVLDAVGLHIPESLPGRSLLRALQARDPTAPASYFESLSPSLNRGWAPLTGVIVGSEKFIDLPIPELYDLASDRDETHNLLPARDDRRRVLEARLREIAPTGAAASGARVQETAEARRQLQALGYVSGSTPAKVRYTAEDDPKRLVDLDRMMQDGVALFQQGQLREALNLYRQVIARRPGMSASRLHAAYIEWEMGDPKAAVETLRQGLQAGADAPDVRVQLGIYLAESGSAADAIRLLSPLQQEAFPDLDGLNGLGIAEAHLGRQNDALAVFDRILQLDADNASAYQNKGTVFLERGDLVAAREALTRAIQCDPNLARALNGLGVVEVKSGNKRAAIEPWKRAVEVDPRQYDTLFNLGVTLLELGDRAEARRYLEQFVRTAPPVFYRKDIEKVGEMLRRLP